MSFGLDPLTSHSLNTCYLVVLRIYGQQVGMSRLSRLSEGRNDGLVLVFLEIDSNVVLPSGPSEIFTRQELLLSWCESGHCSGTGKPREWRTLCCTFDPLIPPGNFAARSRYARGGNRC